MRETEYDHQSITVSETEFAAFEEHPGDVGRGLLLLCDHASNALPTQYGTLGLPPSELQRHIAYDIGARAVTLQLAKILNVPAILSGFSRLLIDPNRGLDDPTLIMRLSDGVVIPGNAYLTPEEKAFRIEHYYRPYHAAIEAAIDRMIAAGKPPVLLSIHSFTDRWKGVLRPWHATVLYDRDLRFAKPLANALRLEPNLHIGENVPYSGELENDCMSQHGSQRGLAHALIEIRQDLIRSASGQQDWAERLARLTEKILNTPAAKERLHRISKDPHFNAEFLPLCELPQS